MAAELARRLKEASDKAAQAEAEQKKKEAEENKRREAEQKRLEELKKDNNLCPKCVQDRGKILEAILLQVLGGEPGRQTKKDMGPAVVEGFRKVKRLGAGGMGEVWLVQEVKTGKNYALKRCCRKWRLISWPKRHFCGKLSLEKRLNIKMLLMYIRPVAKAECFMELLQE